MRITHQMLSRDYIRRMNTNLGNLSGSNDKMTSNRKFNKAHENVTDASRALKIRQLVVHNERYNTNIRDAQGRAEAAEDCIRSVSGFMITAKDRLVEALNGTLTDSDRKKISAELKEYQDEVLSIMNGQFSNKYLFNSAGNADGSEPFKVDKNGELMYNGTYVDTMYKDETTGKPSTKEYNSNVVSSIPWNTDNYVDIGAGYKLTSSGRIDPNTAYKDTYSGVQCFGYGTNDDGVPLNAYSLFGRMVEDLNNNNTDRLELALNAITDSMDFMLTAVTDVGARSVVLENTASRLDMEYVNLMETLNELEYIDLSEETIYNKGYETNWLVTLQLGSKILPQTIFDFLR